MPINTPNLGLEKPIGSEKYDIAKINANFDKIDTNALNKVTYKGEVALLSNLPTTGQKVGDYYIVVEKGVPYVWNGDSFNPQVVIPEVNVSVDSIGDLISSAISKVTPDDSDTFGYSDANDIDNPNRLKKLSWANFKSALKTYFDTFYATITNLNLKAPIANPVFTGTQTLPNIVTNGIKFPATQVPSADPNTLDDYEEGTFTPTITASSGSFTTTVASGRYTKTGNVATCVVEFSTANIGTASGAIIVNGLPFFVGASLVGGSTVVGQELNNTGILMFGFLIENKISGIYKYDRTALISNAASYKFLFTYIT